MVGIVPSSDAEVGREPFVDLIAKQFRKPSRNAIAYDDVATTLDRQQYRDWVFFGMKY